jgi:hypothetical protein
VKKREEPEHQGAREREARDSAFPLSPPLFFGWFFLFLFSLVQAEYRERIARSGPLLDHLLVFEPDDIIPGIPECIDQDLFGVLAKFWRCSSGVRRGFAQDQG